MAVTYAIKHALDMYEKAISQDLVISSHDQTVYKALGKDENGRLVPLDHEENAKFGVWSKTYLPVVPEYGKNGLHCSTRIEDLFAGNEFSEKTHVYKCEIPEGAVISTKSDDYQHEDYGLLATDVIRILHELSPEDVIEEMNPKGRLVSKWSSLPDANYSWPRLTQLVLDGTPIETLPMGVKYISYLDELFMRRTNISVIPDIFKFMHSLTAVHCEGSPINVSKSWSTIKGLLAKDSFLAITGLPMRECPAARMAGFASMDLADGLLCDIVYSVALDMWVWTMHGLDPVCSPEGILDVVTEGLE